MWQVLAICVAQYTGSWGLYGLLNWLPTFFVDVYHVDIAQLGGFTSMSYLAQVCARECYYDDYCVYEHVGICVCARSTLKHMDAARVTGLRVFRVYFRV